MASSSHSTGSKSASSDGSKASSSGPAWKLRLNMNNHTSLDQKNPRGGGADQPKRSSASKFGRKSSKIDPNLPPAFKQVEMQRMAFKRQQMRRKNNDEFHSLNSSHVKDDWGKEQQSDDLSSSLGSDDDSFGDSFGDLQEGDEEGP